MPDINHILFDLDGTLADNSHRTHLARLGRWTEYHDACHKDLPLAGGLALLDLLLDVQYEMYGFGANVTIITGRAEETRGKTVAWLAEHLGDRWTWTERNLVMRQADNRVSNVRYKREFIRGLASQPSHVLLIDDHPGAMELMDCCMVLPVRSTW